MFYLLPRARIRPTRTLNSPHGTPVVREIEIWLGKPTNAYVMFDPEISKAFQSGTVLQGDCSLAQDPELLPLNFHHDTRHFAHDSSPYPRLEIPHDLPRQSNAPSSPATLHTYGVTHAIMLDGTADEAFAFCIRESMQRLQPVLDQLRDS